MTQSFHLVIAGGNSPIAPFLMTRLHELGVVAEVISRRLVDVPDGFTFTHMDLTMARNWVAPEGATIISLLPPAVLTLFLPRFIGVKSMIAVNPHGHSLSDASSGLVGSWCVRSNVEHTLLSTAPIYDGVRDTTVTPLARFIRRMHFFPLMRPASGLRQPVHADDAAQAIVGCLNNKAACNRSFNIGGGELLSYRAMIERIFASLSLKKRLVFLPTNGFQNAASWFFEKGMLPAALKEALSSVVNQDKVIDMSESIRLLKYQPRDFRPDFLL